jgi:hypothetical protein
LLCDFSGKIHTTMLLGGRRFLTCYFTESMNPQNRKSVL